MSSYVDFVKIAIAKAKSATDLDNNKHYKEAYGAYVLAIQAFLAAIKHEKRGSNIQQMLRGKVKEVMARAEELKSYLDSQQSSSNESTNVSGPNRSTPNTDSSSKKKEISKDDEKLERMLSSAILKSKPKIQWDDVAGLENAKDTLYEAVILPLKFPQLFEDTRRPWKGVLLYGPPGTGKSMLGKAVANEAKSTFFLVSAANLTSKYVGESEKLVQKLFGMARDHRPSVVFIDEVDSLCAARDGGSGGGSDAMDRLKTQFLQEMDGVGSDTEGVLVLGATNLPQKLDIAVRRRFERRIYIALPNIEAREIMIKKFIGKISHTLTGENMLELAKKTDGFSGADLNIFVRNAIMEPVRRCRHSKYFKKITGPYPRDKSKIVDDLITPCEKNDPGAMEMTIKNVPEDKLVAPKATFRDFINALKGVKPSVGNEDLLQYQKYTEQYGMEGED